MNTRRDLSFVECAQKVRSPSLRPLAWSANHGMKSSNQENQKQKIEILKNNAINNVRMPKLPQSIPKPLTYEQAKDLIIDSQKCDNNEKTPDWVQIRNKCIFLLLYGCGLRISEALELNIKDAPIEEWQDTIRVRGKGNKYREVPLLADVKDSEAGLTVASPVSAEVTLMLT